MVERYPDRLAKLDAGAFLLPPAEQRLCLLSGQSDLTTSALPVDKLMFLQAVAPPGVVLTSVGFPWHADLAGPLRAPPSLLTASLRNVRQLLWSRWSVPFRAALSLALSTALERTSERLLIVTGSCGIDFLADAFCRLPTPRIDMAVVSLGPAGRLPLGVARHLVVQGRRDRWSRMAWRGPVHVRTACGHLDFYRDPDAIAATASFLAAGWQ